MCLVMGLVGVCYGGVGVVVCVCRYCVGYSVRGCWRWLVWVGVKVRGSKERREWKGWKNRRNDFLAVGGVGG